MIVLYTLSDTIGRQQGSILLRPHAMLILCVVVGECLSYCTLALGLSSHIKAGRHHTMSLHKGGWMWDIRFGCHCPKKKAIEQTALFTQTPATYPLCCEPISWAG